MSESISKYTIFEYYLEDIDCAYCLHYTRKRKKKNAVATATSAAARTSAPTLSHMDE